MGDSRHSETIGGGCGGASRAATEHGRYVQYINGNGGGGGRGVV